MNKVVVYQMSPMVTDSLVVMCTVCTAWNSPTLNTEISIGSLLCVNRLLCV